MSVSYLFDQLNNLKQSFKSFFCQRKKLKALENYSECSAFKHRPYLKLIRSCMDEGFLEERESSFLDHMLSKYEVKFLDWCHKTKWLHEQMREAKDYKKKTDQLLFDFEKLEKIQTPKLDPALAFLAAKAQAFQRRAP